MLVPLFFIDKVLGTIASNSLGEELRNIEAIGLKLIRRSVWKELSRINADKEYENIQVPITEKEFNWLRSKYDSPI